MSEMMKNYLTALAILVTVVGMVTGFVYKEATASRCRDENIITMHQKDIKEVQEKQHEAQVAYLHAINGVSEQIARVQKDIEYIKAR